MKTKSILTVFAATLIAVGAACTTEAVGPSPDVSSPLFSVASPDTMYRLIGNGDYYEAGGNPDLIITAIRHFDGSLTGRVSDPGNARFGQVTGLTPPSEANPFWCVEVALDEVPGFTALVYVEDLDGTSALDRIFLGGGDFGALCATYPVLQTDFSPLLGGDFNGSIKTK